MATWPFWVLFLSAGVLALVVVKRLDDLEHQDRTRRQRDSGHPSSVPPRQKQT